MSSSLSTSSSSSSFLMLAYQEPTASILDLPDELVLFEKEMKNVKDLRVFSSLSQIQEEEEGGDGRAFVRLL